MKPLKDSTMFASDIANLPSRGDCILHVYPEFSELEFKNPAARNAISARMMHQLENLVLKLEESPPRVLIMFGVDVFCAGGDLQDVRRYLMDSAHAMAKYMTGLLNRIQQLPTLVIAAVDGAAIGGGAEITTAADYVICHAEAKIGFVHAHLGVSPGWGGASRLLQKVGPAHALYLLTTAKKCAAEELLMRSLVHEISLEQSAHRTAQTMAIRIAKMPDEAVRTVIQIIKNQEDEQQGFARLWGSSVHRKALGLDES